MAMTMEMTIKRVQRKKIGGQADKNERIYYKETAAGANLIATNKQRQSFSYTKFLIVNRDSIVAIAKHGTVQ